MKPAIKKPMRALTVELFGDCEIVMTRDFNAPRHLVYQALTEPDLVKRWLFGPDGWSMDVCEIDLRVGGKYRYGWRHQNGKTMAMGGEFQEISAPERLVATEAFDESWYPGNAIDTTVLTENAGRTRLTLTVEYESKEARDGVLKTGMADGMSLGYDRLEQVLATI
ncbi:MAG TPA: SRPBCC family protein [Bryobacteraceae bacterium]|nr:SRPBCC family protein [Bryobacteraceae bacterium]